MENFEVVKKLGESTSDDECVPKTPRLRRTDSVVCDDDQKMSEHEQALFDDFMKGEEAIIAEDVESNKLLKNREFQHLQMGIMGLFNQAEVLHKRTLRKLIESDVKLTTRLEELTSIVKQMDDRVDLLVKLLSLKPNNNRYKK